MRRLLTWLSGAAGGIAVYRLLTRRRASVAPEPHVDVRAEELRAKLDASRTIVEDREQFESGEQAVDEGRAAVERMRRSGEEG